MSRPLRIELPDGVYHVTCRGLEKLLIVRCCSMLSAWWCSRQPASVAEIGAYFGGITGPAVSRISRRVPEMIDKNKQFASKLQPIEVRIAKNAKSKKSRPDPKLHFE